MTLRRRVDETYLLTELTRSSTIDTGLLPVGTRLVKRFENRALWMIERSPRTFLARFQPVMGAVVSTIAVPVTLPWQIYLIKTHGSAAPVVRCYWRDKPVTSFDDRLFKCVMPNMHDDGQPCLGNFEVRTSEGALVDQVIQHLMGSSFNTHLGSSQVMRLCPTEIRDTGMLTRVGDTDIPRAEITEPVEYFLRWSAWTAATPQAHVRVCNLPWPEAMTVSKAISYLEAL